MNIRIGPMRDSGLLRRKLVETHFVTVAAPSYLENHGIPETVNDLERHNCLTFAFRRQAPEWKFCDETGQLRSFAPKGNLLLGDGESMRRLTLAGAGIAQLSVFQVQEDLTAGKLVPVLERFAAREPRLCMPSLWGQIVTCHATKSACLDRLSGRKSPRRIVTLPRKDLIAMSAFKALVIVLLGLR